MLIIIILSLWALIFESSNLLKKLLDFFENILIPKEESESSKKNGSFYDCCKQLICYRILSFCVPSAERFFLSGRVQLNDYFKNQNINIMTLFILH